MFRNLVAWTPDDLLELLVSIRDFLIDLWLARDLLLSVLGLTVIVLFILLALYFLSKELSTRSLPKEIEKVANLSDEERAELKNNNPPEVVERLIQSAKDCIGLWEDYLAAKQEAVKSAGQRRLITDMEAWIDLIPRQFKEAKRGNLTDDWKSF